MKTTLTLIALLCSATPAQADSSLPQGATLATVGELKLLPGMKSAAWLEVMNYLKVSEPATELMKSTLGQHGWQWAGTRETAAASVSITGFVRIHNDIKDSRDTGKIEIAAILESGYTDGMKEARQAQTAAASGRGTLDYDAGVSGQLSRGLGVGRGAGIVAAIGVDWLADITGLRRAVNGAVSGGAQTSDMPWRSKPLFCFGECEREFNTLHHVVELNYRAMKGREATPYYTVRVTFDSDKREDPTPLVAAALTKMMQSLAEAQE